MGIELMETYHHVHLLARVGISRKNEYQMVSEFGTVGGGAVA